MLQIQQRLLESSKPDYPTSLLKASTLVGRRITLRSRIPLGQEADAAAPVAQEVQEAGNGAVADPWQAQNARRMVLIRKNVGGALSAEEEEELQELQRMADERIRRLAPLPLEELREFAEGLRQRGIVIPD